MKLYRARILFEPRDLWVGVFWDRPERNMMDRHFNIHYLDVYVCILPMLPIKLEFTSAPTPRAADD